MVKSFNIAAQFHIHSSMNSDLVWWKGNLSKMTLLKLKPPMCFCETGSENMQILLY